MPSRETVAGLYGVDYGASFGNEQSVDPKHPEMVIEFLRTRSPGTFVDFGCGAGGLLQSAQAISWTAIGYELDPQVARRTELQTGTKVLSGVGPEHAGIADVVHLGDVIEHLTDVDADVSRALSLLRPGGYLIAQGPLENNPNLFTFAIRFVRRLRRGAVRMAPYHVILATARGQRALFGRMGLREVRYTVTEEWWPAPRRCGGGARSTALYLLRKLSRAVTAKVGREWGNRYFYVGQLAAQDPVQGPPERPQPPA
jgi:SAM-dependent methyltransferase